MELEDGSAVGIARSSPHAQTEVAPDTFLGPTGSILNIDPVRIIHNNGRARLPVGGGHGEKVEVKRRTAGSDGVYGNLDGMLTL